MVLKFDEKFMLVDAPEGFERSVMAKIVQMPSLPALQDYEASAERALCAILGTIAILAGIVFFLGLTHEAFVGFLRISEYLRIPVNAATVWASIETFASQIVASAGLGISAALDNLLNRLAVLRYPMVLTLVLLIVAQFIIYRRDKGAEAKII